MSTTVLPPADFSATTPTSPMGAIPPATAPVSTMPAVPGVTAPTSPMGALPPATAPGNVLGTAPAATTPTTVMTASPTAAAPSSPMGGFPFGEPPAPLIPLAQIAGLAGAIDDAQAYAAEQARRVMAHMGQGAYIPNWQSYNASGSAPHPLTRMLYDSYLPGTTTLYPDYRNLNIAPLPDFVTELFVVQRHTETDRPFFSGFPILPETSKCTLFLFYNIDFGDWDDPSYGSSFRYFTDSLIHRTPKDSVYWDTTDCTLSSSLEPWEISDIGRRLQEASVTVVGWFVPIFYPNEWQSYGPVTSPNAPFISVGGYPAYPDLAGDPQFISEWPDTVVNVVNAPGFGVETMTTFNGEIFILL